MVAHAFAGLTFGIGSIMLAIPLKHEWRVHGINYVYDGLITELAINLLQAVELVKAVSNKLDRPKRD